MLDLAVGLAILVTAAFAARLTSGGRVPGRWADLRVRTVARLESL